MKISNEELDRRIREWEKRMEKKGKKEDEQQKLDADKLRFQYLKRTGRKEMKP